MSVVVLNRRQFLVGSSGALLALPVLSSLLSAKARAQATQARPRFVCMASSHGCIRESNMYPSDASDAERQMLFADHEVRRRDLRVEVNGGRASLSPVLSASSGRLTQQLASKMNVLRGFDVSWNLGHHTGGHLGNFARNDTNKIAHTARPTIDQVMAYSQRFYPQAPLRRSMHVGYDGNSSISWGYSDPSQKRGAIEQTPSSYSSKELFDSIFVRPSAAPQNAREPVTNRVHEAYKRLHDGAFGDARRLSSEDRRRLQEHMSRITELQERVNAHASCNDVREPSSEVDESTGGLRDMVVYQGRTREFYQVFNEVIVAAFICGSSRIATIYPHGFTSYPGDWHQNVAHNAETGDHQQQLLAEENRALFEELFVDLVAKLDVPEADGRTYLDNSLVMWSQESGPATHDPISLPIVTAGSAAGFLRTGNYCDYRRVSAPSTFRYKPGILYNQWLGTVLQAMGIPPEEYDPSREGGYGAHHKENTYGDADMLWPDRLRQRANEIPPFLGHT